jgi:GSCFA family
MEFRTELSVTRRLSSIELTDNLLTVGSCFADDVGKKLMNHKFSVSANPLGTVYNPVSIHGLLSTALQKTDLSENGFLERDGIFFHYDFHSNWNGKSAAELKSKLNDQLSEVHTALSKAHHLILTYGTAWVYESQETKNVVANCHKMPKGNFEKFLLTQKRIIESFEHFYNSLKKLNPACRIILTVSPVRHVKDTLELNSVSKSILRLSCHTLSQTFSDVVYFPTYEIMLDDLRDYRFYKPDMIHPSEQAVDYIWGKFGDSFFSSATKDFIKEWRKIQAALGHRPFHARDSAHQKFLLDLLGRLNQFRDKVEVGEEIEFVKAQIDE